MRRAFQAFLAMFGVIVIGISLAIIGGVAVNPTMAGEDRFFVGGIGRLLAVLLDGPPHPFYVAMLVLELALPPLIVIVARRVAESD